MTQNKYADKMLAANCPFRYPSTNYKTTITRPMTHCRHLTYGSSQHTQQHSFIKLILLENKSLTSLVSGQTQSSELADHQTPK